MDRRGSRPARDMNATASNFRVTTVHLESCYRRGFFYLRLKAMTTQKARAFPVSGWTQRRFTRVAEGD